MARSYLRRRPGRDHGGRRGLRIPRERSRSEDRAPHASRDERVGHPKRRGLRIGRRYEPDQDDLQEHRQDLGHLRVRWPAGHGRPAPREARHDGPRGRARAGAGQPRQRAEQLQPHRLDDERCAESLEPGSPAGRTGSGDGASGLEQADRELLLREVQLRLVHRQRHRRHLELPGQPGHHPVADRCAHRGDEQDRRWRRHW